MDDLQKGINLKNPGILLALLIISGALLRLAGIDFGLPGQYRPDEEYTVSRTLGVLDGNFNPRVFNWPTLYMYFCAALLYCIDVIGILSGFFAPGDFAYLLARDNLSNAYLSIRIVTAFIGVLGIVAVYQLGKNLQSALYGIIAACLLCFCFIHVRDSHFATTDVPMATLSSYALLFMFIVLSRGSWSAYLLAALFTGCAMSVKYTALALGIPFALCHLLRLWPDPSKSLSLAFHVKALFAAVGCFVFFFAGSPFILLDFENFTQSIEVVRNFARDGIVGAADDINGWKWIFLFCMPQAFGWPMYVMAILGLAISVGGLFQSRPCNRHIFLLSLGTFCLAVLMVYSRSNWSPIRYMVFLVPALAVLSTEFILFIISRFQPGGSRAAVLLLVLITAVYGSLERSIDLNKLLARRDAREFAREWMQRHVRPGESVGSLSIFTYGKPQIVRYSFPSSHRELIPAQSDWVVVDEHPISVFSPRLTDAQRRQLNKSFELKFSINPFTGAWPEGASFDGSDAFYVPLSGFDKVIRPGPKIRIFKRLAAGD